MPKFLISIFAHATVPPFALCHSCGRCCACWTWRNHKTTNDMTTGGRQDKTAATDKYDYECSNGEGWVKDIAEPLWNPANTDEACWSNDACDSGVCVVTNETDTSLGTKVRWGREGVVLKV